MGSLVVLLLGGRARSEGARSMRAVKGERSNRRWAPSSTLKFKGLLGRPRYPTSGLGNRFCDPTQATQTHSGPLQPRITRNPNFGLSLILWTPSVHNQRREVPHGPAARSFTPEFKQEAVDLCRRSGKSECQVARELGIPQRRSIGGCGKSRARPGHARGRPTRCVCLGASRYRGSVGRLQRVRRFASGSRSPTRGDPQSASGRALALPLAPCVAERLCLARWDSREWRGRALARPASPPVRAT